MSIKQQIIAKNRKAHYNYFLEDTMETGVVLIGSEAKSLRLKTCNISESYADVINGEIYILNMNIPKYENSSAFSYYIPTKPRKLLLHKRQIRKIIGKIKQKGYTLVPLCVYFNEKNIAKIEIALAKGKKIYDKREDIKRKDWNRQQARILKTK